MVSATYVGITEKNFLSKFNLLTLFYYRVPKPESQIKQAKRVERDAKQVSAARKARKVVCITIFPKHNDLSKVFFQITCFLNDEILVSYID